MATGASVTLDANGKGTVFLGPGRAGTRWQVTRYTTSGNSTAQPALSVSRATFGLIDTTVNGNADVSEWVTPVSLWSGETLRFDYTGGTPGAVMTVYLEGTSDTG